MSRRQNRPAPASVRHPGSLPEPEGGRHMDSMDRDALTRALITQACHAGLSGADLRVWMAVMDRTLTYRWLSEVVSHSVLRAISGVARPGRSLDALAEAGLIRYWPGGSEDGTSRTLSRLVVLVPDGWERHRSGAVRSPGEGQRAGGDAPTVDETVHGQDGEDDTDRGRTRPPTVDEMVHSSVDELVHPPGRDDPPPMDEMVHGSVDEPVHLTTRETHKGLTTRDTHEGGDHEGASCPSPRAGEGDTPTPSVPAFTKADEVRDDSPSHASASAPVVTSDNGAMTNEVDSSAVIGSEDGGPGSDEEILEDDLGSPPRPGWSLDHGPEPDEDGWAEWLAWSIAVLEADDPLPEPPRIFEPGEVPAEAAVKKFAALGGLPLAPATVRGLTDALRPMQSQCRGAEMLMALGWWQERGRVQYPQDVAEHLTAALLHPHLCDLDPVNGMLARDAIEEGRCRYRWSQMPETTPEQFVAKMRAHDRATNEGITWPLPRNVRGVIPRTPAGSPDAFSGTLVEWRNLLRSATGAGQGV